MREIMPADTSGYSFHKKYRLIKLFLDHGADVNALAYNNELFPLWFAAQLKDTEALKILLRYGANVRLKTTGGRYTALHRACMICVTRTASGYSCPLVRMSSPRTTRV